MTDALLIETPAPGVRQIRLNRPDRLNALGVDMVDALRRAATETDARVPLIRGTGRGFCAGADLKERAGMSEESRIAHNQAINAAVAAAPMPAIAVVTGFALGGGLELALACDLRFAAASAKIGLTEAHVCVIPGAGGTQRMPRLLSTARALELMFSGEPINAARAKTIGLVQAAIPDEDLDAHVLRYAALLASRSPRTARTLKRIVCQGLGSSLADGLALERSVLADLFAGADYAEGLAAFAEKRAPVFQD